LQRGLGHDWTRIDGSCCQGGKETSKKETPTWGGGGGGGQTAEQSCIRPAIIATGWERKGQEGGRFRIFRGTMRMKEKNTKRKKKLIEERKRRMKKGIKTCRWAERHEISAPFGVKRGPEGSLKVILKENYQRKM